jgi:uncharacterized protein with PIN domain
MAKCPSCNKEVKVLIQILDVAEINEFYLEGGNPQTNNIDYGDIPSGGREFYDCPECDHTIAKSQKEAVAFLTPKKKNPDNPNVGVLG